MSDLSATSLIGFVRRPVSPGANTDTDIPQDILPDHPTSTVGPIRRRRQRGGEATQIPCSLGGGAADSAVAGAAAP